ncbi:ester cyclase [Spirosoma koreense]
MLSETDHNKAIVTRFNKEAIEQGRREAFDELIADSFINRTAPAGMPPGREGMVRFILDVLRPAFGDLRVEIYDQIAEGDKVVTRKAFHATHVGPFMGIPATGRSIIFPIIDIIRLQDGKYVEHWSIRDTHAVLQQLTQA